MREPQAVAGQHAGCCSGVEHQSAIGLRTWGMSALWLGGGSNSSARASWSADATVWPRLCSCMAVRPSGNRFQQASKVSTRAMRPSSPMTSSATSVLSGQPKIATVPILER